MIFCIISKKMTKINNLRHIEKSDHNKIFFVDIISLLMGFSGGLLTYTTSTYFKNIVGNINIGWTFLIANIIILITLFTIHKFARIIGKETLFHLLIICKISLFIAIILLFGSLSSIVLLMIYIVFEALSWAILKMILESHATDSQSGRIYGFNLTVTNIGIAIAPIIASQLLTSSGFNGIFYLSLALNIIIFCIAYFTLRQSPSLTQKNINYNSLVKQLRTRPDIVHIFSISCALEFFFAVMVIYTPIYLIESGFTWNEIGIIFTIMLIPFILVHYPIGLLADKKLGEKELLLFSFLLITISSIFLYFYDDAGVIAIMIILFVSRIGASIIGILRLSYFYKRIDTTNTDLIAFFHMARPIAFIITPAITGVLLIYFHLHIVFIITAIIALAALYPVYKINDNNSEAAQ